MRITVWEHQDLLVSINPLRYKSEQELLKALKVQSFPDQEYHVRLDDGSNSTDFFFDGSDGLDIIAVLCHRGMANVVFTLDISAHRSSRYMKERATPDAEVLLESDIDE